MKSLVLLDHENNERDNNEIRAGARSAVAFANSVAQQTGGEVTCLVLGANIESLANQAAAYAPTLCFDSPLLEQTDADRWAPAIAEVVKRYDFDLLVASSTSFSKDVVGRAAGLLGGHMASDVIAHNIVEGELHLQRPMCAGSVLATIKLLGSPRIVTIRSSAYEPATASPSPHPITVIPDLSIPEASRVRVTQTAKQQGGRPDVTEARVVVSGGRAWKNSEDFETHVGGLADQLSGAAGSSRALVDAGITPNELQVGQTGKIVAPELYLALGLSGAVQHLAGMKNSKTIAAINNDPDAPIFHASDFGLVGDVYELTPQLIERLA